MTSSDGIMFCWKTAVYLLTIPLFDVRVSESTNDVNFNMFFSECFTFSMPTDEVNDIGPCIN